MINTVEYRALTVVKNEELGPGHHLLVLETPKPLPDISAGHFLNLRCSTVDKHSLLRPFSVLDADPLEGTISVYYKELGRMSRHLSNIVPGMQLDCLYPLGQPFPWRNDWRRVALVGGGVGLAPMLFLAKQLEPYGERMSVTGYFGGGSEPDLVQALLGQYNFEMHLATMDGSAGTKGTVVDLFALSEEHFDVIYTCGPNPMMAALKAVLPEESEAFASLEEYMACGVGACLGCVAKIEQEDGTANLPVCKDGPVFDLRKVQFE